jgi:uncharacterized membrane protein
MIRGQPSHSAFSPRLPLVFRAISGGFSSLTLCASAHQSLLVGTILGVVGALAGAFAGYEIRHLLVEAFGLPDFGVALAEDIVAIRWRFTDRLPAARFNFLGVLWAPPRFK